MPFQQAHYQKLLFTLCCAMVIGACGGLATHAFRELLTLLSNLLFGHVDSPVRTASELSTASRILIPTLGGMLAGYILQAIRQPSGTPVDYMEAVTLGNGHLPARHSLLRAASSACSIASGSAIGREASMIQLAALTGSGLVNLLKLGIPQKRLLVACGAAAGITAAYNTPIAAALFVSEIVLKSIAIESLAPLVLAAATAQLVSRPFLGTSAIYHIPPIHDIARIDWYWFLLTGIVAGLCAPVFLWLMTQSKRLFGQLNAALWVKLGLGGLIVGGLSVIQPEVWGNGYETVDHLLKHNWTISVLIAVLICKSLATAAATGSGAIGGIFTPSLFVGAVIGGVIAHLAHGFFPYLPETPLWIIVGMGAFLGATTHAPLMAILMLFEMTQAPLAIVPLMLATISAYMITRALGGASVYAKALPDSTPETSPVARLLRSDAPYITYPPQRQHADALFQQYRWPHVYVTDADHRFLGAISLHDFRQYLQQAEAQQDAGTLPDQLIKMDYPRIQVHQSVETSLQVFITHQGERLPAIGSDGLLAGYVTKNDLLKLLGSRWSNAPDAS
ncbi:ClcB-like voltage-gated chloride channel protein [Leeia oryzae]|uniref:ClcB-like voltage-gated chloride channel protein n=1 Tax=Leeia oryzae TaxID=356662 RepID=UPI00037434C1|nr:ClcB-like voltage-gated chloride channel protein [Leeia oryzae]